MEDENKYSINRATRFLVVEEPSGLEYVITDLSGSKKLQKIYRKLAAELWG
tara:strand:+ start:428 stop:580 length:153 start_codon:yes stop_codon:yes gene_type:complete